LNRINNHRSVHFVHDRSPIGASQQHDNEPPPLSCEIGAPSYIR
jgi:hypothetical protein